MKINSQGFTYDSPSENLAVTDVCGQRVNMTYDSGMPRSNITRLPLADHLVNPTYDPGPGADEPLIIEERND